MEAKARNPWVAGILSGIVPGLGQFYNRQWGKGAAFIAGIIILFGILSSSVDPKALDQAAASGTTPGNLGLVLILLLVILVVAIWSIADAARMARRSATPPGVPPAR